MSLAIQKRGPNDSGTYLKNGGCFKGRNLNIGLGHQRLSIIDLSRAARQPMSNEDGSIWVVYNGEIYNFLQIADRFLKGRHQFKSRSDTEVILHLYEEMGIGAAEQFNGMFAFGLWDEKIGRLWLCRDRAGIKPLVYYWDGHRFSFASEIKALLTDPEIPREIDETALQLYLALSYIPAPYTIFKGIRKLPPGHHLIFENGDIAIHPYWELALEDSACLVSPETSSVASYQKALRERLADSVRSRLIADVPLGAFLSGGIDSSIIVGLMAQFSSAPVKTFSIGFKDDAIYDETQYARKVARRYDTDHYEFKLTFKDMLDVLPEVIDTFDEPFSDSSAIPTYIVSRETRRYVKVALSGDGGDELFAGYRSYLGQYWHSCYMFIPAWIRTGLVELILGRLPDSRDIKWMEYIRRFKKFIRASDGTFEERLVKLKEIMPSDIRSRILCDQTLSNSEDVVKSHLADQLAGILTDPINLMLYSDFKDSLPGDMLAKVDWMSMKNSLEVRVPFLDQRVVELAFSIPGPIKMKRGVTKYLLKDTFKDLLPKSILKRPKAGFEVPISRWLREELKFLIDRYLNPDRIERQGIFSSSVVNQLVQNHLNVRTDTSWMIWNLIVFQNWYDRYID